MLGAPAVQAGAWAREKGQYFIALGGNFLLSEGAQLPVHYDPTLYAEYGWDGHITLGTDIHTADAGRIISGFAFASVPIGSTEGANRFSGQLGFGTLLKQGDDPVYQLRAGLSWGRGLSSGWLSVDGSATITTADKTFRPKLDATWGHVWSDKWTTTIQLQTGQGTSDDYYAKLAPSVTYDLRSNIKLHLGAVQALTGDQGTALKFETWLTF